VLLHNAEGAALLSGMGTVGMLIGKPAQRRRRGL